MIKPIFAQQCSGTGVIGKRLKRSAAFLNGVILYVLMKFSTVSLLAAAWALFLMYSPPSLTRRLFSLAELFFFFLGSGPFPAHGQWA